MRARERSRDDARDDVIYVIFRCLFFASARSFVRPGLVMVDLSYMPLPLKSLATPSFHQTTSIALSSYFDVLSRLSLSLSFLISPTPQINNS